MMDRSCRAGSHSGFRSLGIASALLGCLFLPRVLAAPSPPASFQEGGDEKGKEEKKEKEGEKKNENNEEKKKNEKKRVVYRVVDRDQNRFVVGDPQKFAHPAQIDILAVLSKIPAYQQIVKEKLTDKDPRYYFLLQEATKSLVGAAEIVTRKAGYDLVADVGAVEADGGEIPDLTEAVIEALKK